MVKNFMGLPLVITQIEKVFLYFQLILKIITKEFL